jgi:hypothetical protein
VGDRAVSSFAVSRDGAIMEIDDLGAKVSRISRREGTWLIYSQKPLPQLKGRPCRVR